MNLNLELNQLKIASKILKKEYLDTQLFPLQIILVYI